MKEPTEYRTIKKGELPELQISNQTNQFTGKVQARYDLAFWDEDWQHEGRLPIHEKVYDYFMIEVTQLQAENKRLEDRLHKIEEASLKGPVMQDVIFNH